MQHDTDIAWMRYALTLAKNGLYTTRENPRVGCVLVKNGEKIAEGWHEFPGGPHAEINALAQAGDKAMGATAYVTLSPCTHYGKTKPCFDALQKAGIARIVAATRDPNPLVTDLPIETDICADEAIALNPGFFMRMQHHRPFIRLKTAMSLDGRIAMQNGESQWITSSASRALVQQLRAQSSAIMTGIDTVLIDDPSLSVRDEDMLKNPYFVQPKRVVVDSHLRISPAAKLLSLPGEVWIYTLSTDKEKTERLLAQGANVFVMPNVNEHVDLHAVFTHLAAQGINEVLIEAGSTLNGALLQENLVDEWYLFVAPKILGDTAKPLCELSGMTQLSQAIQLNIKEFFSVGEDFCYIATIQR